MKPFKLTIAIVSAVALMALTAALLVNDNSSSAPAAQSPAVQSASSDSSHEQPAFVRSLTVTTKAEPAPSAHPERMRALLLTGELPSGVVTATVLTDEDCAPDADGVSHCRNKLRLRSGKTIEVRHPHRMHDVPCMTPGEPIRVSRAVDA